MNPRIFYKTAGMTLFIVLIFTAYPVEAQYFGRNKVQYDTFDFKVISTKNFDLYFYPEGEEAARMAARMAERWYSRLSRILQHELSGRQILILYTSGPHFQQTTAIPRILGEGVGGVTESLKRRIVLPMSASLEESNHVIGHELVHAFQYDITGQYHSDFARVAPSIQRLPLWFVEGMAEYLSLGPVDSHTAMWMRDILKKEELPGIHQLNNPRYFPYRYGHAVWAYITGRWGDQAVPGILKRVGRAGDYRTAIKEVTGEDIKDISQSWHKSLREAYQPVQERTLMVDELSEPLIPGTRQNSLNISPALSPDGKSLVFLSTKDIFSIDMFLADAETGEFKRKLVSTAVNPHFSSLQFTRSAGSWDFDGRRFVFGAVTGGDPVLSILNIPSGDKVREIRFPELGEVLNPAWSPDGRNIVFSALDGGVSNLFLYDLETDQLTKLTDDPYADLYPAWSPDGRKIAFSTDRFSTDLALLDIGHFELAMLDIQTRKIQKLPGFSEAKNINPQWSSDSRELYFISDRTGISNLYNLDLETETITQITDLYTGVSGITELSPALSVASATEKLAYCIYENDYYSIYSVESGRELIRGEQTVYTELRPSVLPPRSQPEGTVAGLLRNPLFGLPEAREYQPEDYKSALTLDYIAPPQMAVGVDRFGTYGGGGIALFFSDVLGYQSLATMAQVSSRILNSAAAVSYLYKQYRWNFGGVAQRMPYVTGGFTQSVQNVRGEPALVEQEFTFRQVNYQVSALAEYPFSQVFRFELSGGYQYLNFDREVRTRAVSLIDNATLINEKESLPAPDSLHFGRGSAALVYDSSYVGATSPVLGQRYRMEVSPMAGSINFAEVLTDYRRYFMPVQPFTLAFRFMHYGRYGPGAEDSRLYPLFMGYQTMVRGYNTASFSAEECGEEGCQVFNQLFGSKMMVANLELRFPLFNVLGIGRGFYGILPVEFSAFFDSGLAWNTQDKAWFLGGDRRPVKSAGIGLRMNIFGYAIAGISYVYPFDRPNKDAYFQFWLTPGF
ncbi:MAG: BamA/TamA family outer membrane protein [Candidatus Aminicenantes bacterium]